MQRGQFSVHHSRDVISELNNLTTRVSNMKPQGMSQGYGQQAMTPFSSHRESRVARAAVGLGPQRSIGGGSHAL